jgi:hypothetical protein
MTAGLKPETAPSWLKFLYTAGNRIFELEMPPGKRRGALSMADFANARMSGAAKGKGQEKRVNRKSKLAARSDEEGSIEDEDGEESSIEDEDGEESDIDAGLVKKREAELVAERSKLKNLEGLLAVTQQKRLRAEEKVTASTAGKIVRIIGGKPVPVTAEDIEEYDGNLESAMHGVRVEHDQVCNQIF